MALGSAPKRKFKVSSVEWTLKKKLLLLFIGMIVITVILQWIFNNPMPSEDSYIAKPLFLCTRGPEVKAIDSTIGAFDRCTGSAKIQVYKYVCGKQTEASTKTLQFLTEISEVGRRRCQSMCESVGKGCKGVFTPPSRCGFSLAPKHAGHMGEGRCHFACSGDALIYCSIYHAGYLQADSAQLSRQAPNCTCVQR